MSIIWNPNLGYVVGLITADGSLSKDARHIEFTSKDLEQVELFSKILNLRNKISTKKGSYTNSGFTYRIQFGDIKLYSFLNSIGITANKTKTIGPLDIPDEYFRDFLRGYLDGDGCIYTYKDKRWKSSYMIYTLFYSSSKNFLIWLRDCINRLYDLEGILKYQGKSTYRLEYAKYSSIKLSEIMYYEKSVPHLKRKHSKVVEILDIIRNSK